MNSVLHYIRYMNIKRTSVWWETELPYTRLRV